MRRPQSQNTAGGLGDDSGILVQLMPNRVGVIRTSPTRSSGEDGNWLRRHLINSRTKILYNPNGPEVKFADESPWNVYPWQKVFAFFLMMAFSILFFSATRRRLPR